MTEVVSRRPLTTEVRLRFQLSQCEIYSKQSGTRTGFSQVPRFYPVSIILPMLNTYLQLDVSLTSRASGRKLLISKSNVLSKSESTGDKCIFNLCLTFRHRASCMEDRHFATLQRTFFIYLTNKYISLSDIRLTVHHRYK
jgi:hypothetical protein